MLNYIALSFIQWLFNSFFRDDSVEGLNIKTTIIEESGRLPDLVEGRQLDVHYRSRRRGHFLGGGVPEHIWFQNFVPRVILDRCLNRRNQRNEETVIALRSLVPSPALLQ